MPTWVFMIILLIIIAGWDIYLAASDKKTYSQTFRWIGKLWPPSRIMICVAIGGVLGHLYWTKMCP